MKYFILMSFLTLFSTTALADLAEYHEKILCNSNEALALRNGSGSCDLLITRDIKQDKKLYCIGKLSPDITCLVTFINEDATGTLSFKCHEKNVSKSLIDTKMAATFAHYNVSVLITTPNNMKRIINDESSYSYIENKVVMASIEEYKERGELKLRGEIAILLENSQVILQEMKCNHL